MEFASLIEALSSPAAYPYPVEQVQVHQTHISAVFLAGPWVYKIKKPVDLGFLDFRSLAQRRHFCAEEVRLNRRLAPDVYRGVVPVTRAQEGLRFEGEGEPIEWAVQMQRLPEAATLGESLRRGSAGTQEVQALARRLAEFHAQAEAGERIAAFGKYEAVARNALENFEQAAAQVGTALHPSVFDRLQSLTRTALEQLRPLIEERAARGVPRDTHGDLHLDHVYLFPEKPPPADLVIVDCIEFNERFRHADPVADMAFLVMDLSLHGHRDLARTFADTYFQAAGDHQGRALLPFYTAYRAAVRGKVEGLRAQEQEVPQAERSAALERARAHWLLALGELEPPGRRPCLILAAGLPGAGKSTLARGLAERASCVVIRSDVVRKELAGPAPAEDLYTPHGDERTYAECLRRAEGLLFEGRRVVVDASFRAEGRRRTFLEAATRWGVPGVLLHCRVDPDEARRRLRSRRGDVSDADWDVYRELARRWEDFGPDTRPSVESVPAEGEAERTLAAALALLRARNLADGE